MSTDPGGVGGETGPEGRPPTEEELRAAYEAEIDRIKVEQVLLEHVVTLINLGMRRTGLVPGTEAERDPTQVRVAIEAIRAQLPLLEQTAPQQISPIREALSQLQLAYVRIGGAPGPAVGGATGGRAWSRRRRARSRRRRSRSRRWRAGPGEQSPAASQAGRARPRPAQRPALGAWPVAAKFAGVVSARWCRREDVRRPRGRLRAAIRASARLCAAALFPFLAALRAPLTKSFPEDLLA